MTNLLWNDIQAQGDNLQHVVDHLLGTERRRLEEAAAFLQRDRCVVLTGLGSAAYLCMPSEVYLGMHGWPARVIYSSEALYNLLPSLENSNVVINSRSGETVELVKLGKALHERGIPFVTITNEPESTLAKVSSRIVWTDSRKDELVSINIVTSMMLTTLMLSAAALGKLDGLVPALRRLPEQMEQVVSQATARAEEMWEYFKDIRPIYLIYRGLLKGSAFNGRLVMEEIARTPGIAMEAGDFRQGPNEVIDERFGALLFASEGHQGRLNLSLGRDILTSGGRVMMVGRTHGWQEAGGLSFDIDDVPEELLPVLAVVPAQLLAYKLAEHQGYNPGEVRYISKVILTEEGIPNG